MAQHPRAADRRKAFGQQDHPHWLGLDEYVVELAAPDAATDLGQVEVEEGVDAPPHEQSVAEQEHHLVLRPYADAVEAFGEQKGRGDRGRPDHQVGHVIRQCKPGPAPQEQDVHARVQRPQLEQPSRVSHRSRPFFPDWRATGAPPPATGQPPRTPAHRSAERDRRCRCRSPGVTRRSPRTAAG